MHNTIHKKLAPAAALSLLASVALVWSCNQDFSRVIPEREHTDSVEIAFGTPRVLYIIADGARGRSVQDAELPNISTLLPNAIYSWASLSDEDTSPQNGTNWADLVTGVQKNKHGIVGDDFANAKLDNFPLLFERVKTASPDSDVRAYTSSAAFHEHLTVGADTRERLADDAAVQAAAASALATEGITLVTAHFTSPATVGNQYGYDLSVPEYRTALTQFDERVGALLAALRNRPNFTSENWLVVVTSSKGGDFTVPDHENDNTIFSDPEVNTFTIFYSNRYETRIVNKPFLGIRFQGDFVRFRNQVRAEVTAGDNAFYNLDNGAFTIELKVKKNPGPNNNFEYQWPALLSKRERWTWDYVGWTIFLDNRGWQFNARGRGGNAGQTNGANLANATWNSIAVVGVIRDGQRYARTYTNGVFNNEVNITNYGSISNDLPLTLGGRNDNGQADCYIADVRIWKVALPEDVLRQYSCETGVPQDHPYYDFLAGLWPIVGSEGDEIRDEGPLGGHMTLSGDGLTRDPLADYVCAPSSADLGRFVPRNIDVPVQIMTWLRIPRQENWQLDGRVWLDR